MMLSLKYARCWRFERRVQALDFDRSENRDPLLLFFIFIIKLVKLRLFF